MTAKALCALLASLSLLGCRDEAKEIVLVDSRLRHAHPAACADCAGRDAREQADDFEHAVAADAGHEPGCAGIVIVEDRALHAGPVYQPVRQPHWVLAIRYVPSGESQTWLLAHNVTGVVRGYGQGTGPEIAHALCTALAKSGPAPP